MELEAPEAKELEAPEGTSSFRRDFQLPNEETSSFRRRPNHSPQKCLSSIISRIRLKACSR